MSNFISLTKLVGESLDLEFNFLSRLFPAETIVSHIANVVVFAGTDPTPSAMLSGATSLASDGVTVIQKIQGGKPGVIYTVSCSVRTSLNNILVNETRLAVLTGSSVTPP